MQRSEVDLGIWPECIVGFDCHSRRMLHGHFVAHMKLAEARHMKARAEAEAEAEAHWLEAQERHTRAVAGLKTEERHTKVETDAQGRWLEAEGQLRPEGRRTEARRAELETEAPQKTAEEERRHRTPKLDP